MDVMFWLTVVFAASCSMAVTLPVYAVPVGLCLVFPGTSQSYGDPSFLEGKILANMHGTRPSQDREIRELRETST